MARKNELDRVKRWEGRIISANKLYDKWSTRFDTPRLEDYYLGRQWKGQTEEEAQKRYVINMVFSSIETNKPALIFDRPKVRVQPRPTRSEEWLSTADARAKLCEDIVQTFIDDPDFAFSEETSLALHEAHFRFGVIEVGYSADFIDNPDAGKPILKEGKEVHDSEGKAVLAPERLIDQEHLYIKRIPAAQFRVSISSANVLHRNDWVGYYEWQYIEDVKRNDNYKNTSDLKSSGSIRKDIREGGTDEITSDELDRRHGMVRIWKIWDIRKKVRHVMAEGHKRFLQEDIPFDFLPFSVVKLHEVLDNFYPIPPTYQWIGPQDEVNETRDSQRAHRRRFYRRYIYVDGAIDTDELEKLENGGDGVYAKAKSAQPVVPIPDAPLSADVWQHLDESKSDFVTVSGITHEQRGVAESETATQATILDSRSRLRESAARTRVARWLAQVSRLMLLTIRDNMALPFWIKRTTDPFAAPEEKVKVAVTWQQITSEQMGDTDLDVFVDLSSMSPITEEIQRNSWNQVLALLTNPQILAIMAQSEAILRKTLNLYGIQAENEIREIQRVANVMFQQMVAVQAAQAAADAGLPATAGATGDALSASAGAPGPTAAMDQLLGPPMAPMGGIA